MAYKIKNKKHPVSYVSWGDLQESKKEREHVFLTREKLPDSAQMQTDHAAEVPVFWGHGTSDNTIQWVSLSLVTCGGAHLDSCVLRLRPDITGGKRASPTCPSSDSKTSTFAPIPVRLPFSSLVHLELASGLTWLRRQVSHTGSRSFNMTVRFPTPRHARVNAELIFTRADMLEWLKKRIPPI